MEAMKARSHCAKSFWCFAVQVLDDDEHNVNPMFSEEEAETLFHQTQGIRHARLTGTVCVCTIVQQLVQQLPVGVWNRLLQAARKMGRKVSK